MNSLGGLLYRTKRGKTILRKAFLAFYIALIFFSILMVVSFPSPIKPKTSIGMINIIVLILGLISFPKIKQEIQRRSAVYGTPMDILVIIFYLTNITSLLFTERIQDFTPIRMVTSAVMAYFFVKVYTPSEKEKMLIIHALGGITIGIALLSVLQAFLPTIMNHIATVYFQGREAYGLAIEQGRGRIAPWGSIILIFPFFYASIDLKKGSRNRWYIAYILTGFIVLLLAMTLSNFRWIFIVFLLGTGGFVRLMTMYKSFSLRQILYTLIIGIVVLVLGLVGSRIVLGYNLIDRFLLSNNTRDVSDTLGRLLLYSQALNVFSSAPLTGAGVGNYYSLVGAFQLNRYFSIFDQFQVFLVPIASHNEFLTVLAETGLIGFISFFLIIYFSFKHIYILLFARAARSSIDRIWIICCFLSLVCFLLYTMFENIYPENTVFIFLLIGIIQTWFIPYTLSGNK